MEKTTEQMIEEQAAELINNRDLLNHLFDAAEEVQMGQKSQHEFDKILSEKGLTREVFGLAYDLTSNYDQEL
ncbi:hypothetical protein KY306_00815 [Candidatus Woesearchaeota archaeon]|nr:hypothetical protein [Candidatus Woesearchaeota archaeon]